MNNRVRWHMNVVAGAIAIAGGVATLDVQALGLGRITVQSSLGEPLRAEIDIAEISADEAASLRAGVAPAAAFKAAGLEYNVAVADMQVSLQKRSDGRAYLRLSTTRPITEPFVDLILEANWASGRIVRDYTMLLDPPSLRAAAPAPVAPTAPMLSRPVAPATAGVGRAPYAAPVLPPVGSAPVAKVPPVKAPAMTAAPTPAPRTSSAGDQQIAVKQGDTAGRIAAQNKPANISLDQMLVALLRNNPDAFASGNINRLKSGAILTLPTSEEAAATSGNEASRTIVAQSKDFNDFRRKLALAAPTTQVDSGNRQASGKIDATVEDRKPASATPDKLTLSKGAIQNKTAVDEKIVKQRQAKDASDRVAELTKNIGDLNRIAGAPATPVGASPTASSAKSPAMEVARPGVSPVGPAQLPSTTPAVVAASAAKATVPAASSIPAPVVATASSAESPGLTPAVVPAIAPASAANPATPAVSAAGAALTGSTAAPTASAPAATAPVKKPVTLPPPATEPSLIDTLTDSPFTLSGLAALLLLLAGLGFYRYKNRNSVGQVDSSFLESRLQPDSFFGASGGQRIDTSEGGATGSSLVYSPSQLDAAGDVDPVAEADVYLAYGRDLQAEEILKEAMRTNPGRVAIYAKLAEIYAKRRDAKAFEVVALEAYNMTRAEGPEWAYMVEMGQELDPGNLLYQPGGHPHLRDPAVGTADTEVFGSSTTPQVIEPRYVTPSAAVDLDLDLDFSTGDEAAARPSLLATAAPAPFTPPAKVTVLTKALPREPMFDGLDMDFLTSSEAPNTVTLKPVAAAPQPSTAKPAFDLSADDFTLPDNGISFTIDEPPVAKPAVAAAPPVADNGMLEFDLSALSLDLNGPNTKSPLPGTALATSEDPLETKFLLAEEFRALGDKDGARALADEVVAEASGTLKSKAQAFLNALS